MDEGVIHVGAKKKELNGTWSIFQKISSHTKYVYILVKIIQLLRQFIKYIHCIYKLVFLNSWT